MWHNNWRLFSAWTNAIYLLISHSLNWRKWVYSFVLHKCLFEVPPSWDCSCSTWLHHLCRADEISSPAFWPARCWNEKNRRPNNKTDWEVLETPPEAILISIPRQHRRMTARAQWAALVRHNVKLLSEMQAFGWSPLTINAWQWPMAAGIPLFCQYAATHYCWKSGTTGFRSDPGSFRRYGFKT